MRSPALLATLCFVPLLAGCPVSSPCFATPALPTPPAAVNTAVVDKPVTVVLDAPAAASCSNDDTAPRPVEWIEVEVLSPSNAPVVNTATGLDTAVVKFTPTEAGRYQVTAFFQPNLGKAAASVEVFGSGRTGPLAILPRECSHLERLGADALICDDLIFSTDGGVLLHLTGAKHAGFEDVLWSWETAGISRRQFDGGTLQLTNSGLIPSNAIPDSLAATREALYASASNEAFRIARDGSSVRIAQKGVHFGSGFALTLVASGEKVVSFDENRSGNQCVLGVDGGLLTFDACQRTDAGLLGHSRDALYLTEKRNNFGGSFGANPTEVVRVAVNGRDGIQRVPAPESPNPVVLTGFRGSVVPWWGTGDGLLLPRFRDGVLSMELLTGLDAGFTVSEELVWKRSGGRTEVLVRQ